MGGAGLTEQTPGFIESGGGGPRGEDGCKGLRRMVRKITGLGSSSVTNGWFREMCEVLGERKLRKSG